jgi:hypothetical protein
MYRLYNPNIIKLIAVMLCRLMHLIFISTLLCLSVPPKKVLVG